jgi:hypothetical protein
VRYAEIAWIHKKIVKRSVNFVPVGRSVSLVIHVLRESKGKPHLKQLNFLAKESEVDALFARVAEAAPWALIGWEPGLENKPQEVVARVQKKKATLAELSPPSA